MAGRGTESKAADALEAEMVREGLLEGTIQTRGLMPEHLSLPQEKQVAQSQEPFSGILNGTKVELRSWLRRKIHCCIELEGGIKDFLLHYNICVEIKPVTWM